MRYLYAFLSVVLFFAVLGLSVKNAEPVTLHYYMGMVWHAPLVLMLLIFFGVGTAVGIMACLGLVIRQRRQLALLKRELAQLNSSLPDTGFIK
jgi:uncharacterized integral membrane protein